MRFIFLNCKSAAFKDSINNIFEKLYLLIKHIHRNTFYAYQFNVVIQYITSLMLTKLSVILDYSLEESVYQNDR